RSPSSECDAHTRTHSTLTPRYAFDEQVDPACDQPREARTELIVVLVGTGETPGFELPSRGATENSSQKVGAEGSEQCPTHGSAEPQIKGAERCLLIGGRREEGGELGRRQDERDGSVVLQCDVREPDETDEARPKLGGRTLTEPVGMGETAPQNTSRPHLNTEPTGGSPLGNRERRVASLLEGLRPIERVTRELQGGGAERVAAPDAPLL